MLVQMWLEQLLAKTCVIQHPHLQALRGQFITPLLLDTRLEGARPEALQSSAVALQTLRLAPIKVVAYEFLQLSVDVSTQTPLEFTELVV